VIYDRDRFVRLGGFDGTLRNHHWKLMDFGFRAHLWGEDIRCTQLVRLSYDGEGEPEDNTTGVSYRRFYLKNLAPVFRKDYAHIPLRFFPAFFFKSWLDPFSAWHEFSTSRSWVKVNRYRFRQDARILTGAWKHPGDTPPSELPGGADNHNGSILNYKAPENGSAGDEIPPLQFRLPRGPSKT
jgi:hypothetical protein